MDTWAPVLPHDTSESLFGRVLSLVYDTVLANRPHMIDHPAVRDAQALVRVTRLKEASGGISVGGYGVSAQRGEEVLIPGDLMIDGPRVMRDLMRAVAGSDGRGVVIHINNLESLAERALKNTAEILRGLRDPMLMHPGLHVLFVGTVEAVQVGLASFPQVRNVTSISTVEPLDIETVHDLLEARYRYVAAGPQGPYIPPVTREAVAALYDLYRGDLRGLLKALEDGVSPLLGLQAEGNEPRPLDLRDLSDVLQRRYERDLESIRETAKVEHLRTWGRSAPSQFMTQKDLVRLWGVKQPTVSATVQFLMENGYVVALPRESSEDTQYALSGTARLVFG